MAKRTFDLVISTALFVLLAPFSMLIAILVKLDSPGPCLYRGKRVGRNCCPFEMLKFRTMVDNAEMIGGASTASDDARITRIGKFLRRFKLDEIPQLINVIRGEMSLVGPRPNVQFDVDLYSKEERRILSVRPGITDYASIRYSNEGEILCGCSNPDEAYNSLIRPGKIFLQLKYVDERSLFTDLKILWLTLYTVVCCPFGLAKPYLPIPPSLEPSPARNEKEVLRA